LAKVILKNKLPRFFWFTVYIPFPLESHGWHPGDSWGGNSHELLTSSVHQNLVWDNDIGMKSELSGDIAPDLCIDDCSLDVEGEHRMWSLLAVHEFTSHVWCWPGIWSLAQRVTWHKRHVISSAAVVWIL